MSYLILLLLPLVSSLTYSTDHSFRGSIPHHASAPENYQISGHSTTLPGITDYLRLVPPMPLAFGGLFTKKPMMSDEWVVEMAFRVHGRNVVLEGEKGEGHSGGRGLAFWYTKSTNPTAITGSSDPKQAVSQVPPPLPIENDPLDPLISLFGNKITFDGLAVIFDTSPSTPLLPRSTQDNDEEVYTGAAVVSGIMDDGTGKWLDTIGKDGRVVHEEKEEASYLATAVGACEAAFRNTDGVLFARISHVNQSIKVELDLTPHTSLAVAGRHYAHTCFTIEGISLPKGSFFGVTGLNSAGAEPDSVDIYSMEVFEVIKTGKDHIEEEKPAPEIHRTKPLDGTQKASTHSLGKLTHELFLAQARQVEATDDLARRLDALILAVKPQSLDEILTRLTHIEAGLHANVAEVAKGAAGSQRTDSDVLTQLLQFQERLMVEIKGLNRKIDGANSATTASLQSIHTRHNEHTTLLQEVADISSSTTSIWWYVFGVVLIGSIMLFFRTRGDGFGGGKKMI